MIILKIVLFILPFLSIFNFPNKQEGFLKIFGLYSFLILGASLFLQFFGNFNIENILFFQGVLVFISLFLFFYFSKNLALPKIDFINLFLLGIFFLFFIFLLFPNNYFTGTYSDRFETFQTEEEIFYTQAVLEKTDAPQYYPYPFYSDEWVNYGFVKSIIETRGLPLYDFLNQNENFINLLLPFHSFLSYFLLFFDLQIENFYMIGVFFNFLIILSLYFISRNLSLSKLTAAFCSGMALFIAVGSNVTGMWQFIPINISLLFLLLFYWSRLKNLFMLSHFMTLISVILYQPIILFFILNYIIILFQNFQKISQNKLKYIFLTIMSCVALLTIFILLKNTFEVLMQNIIKLLVRPTLHAGIERFSIYHMIVPVFFPFILIGFFPLFEKSKILFSGIIFGLIFWFYYSFSNIIFIIDKPRVVFVTCILLLIPLGIGIEYVYRKLLFFVDNPETLKTFYKYSFFFFFLILFVQVWSYTDDTKWSNLVLELDNGMTINSLPPVNNYYKQEDFETFKNYNNKIFLSEPWTGLIIGSLTNNYPLETKGSYIGSSRLRYLDFLNSNCLQKINLAKIHKLDLYYGPEIDCKNFDLVHSNISGKFLYKFNLEK